MKFLLVCELAVGNWTGEPLGLAELNIVQEARVIAMFETVKMALEVSSGFCRVIAVVDGTRQTPDCGGCAAMAKKQGC